MNTSRNRGFGALVAVAALLMATTAQAKDVVVNMLNTGKEGVYPYHSLPHKVMGMVGVIQAGRPLNLPAAHDVAKRESAGFATGTDRIEKALAHVQ